MLEDVAGIRRVVLACGRVDLRKGIDGLGMGLPFGAMPTAGRIPEGIMQTP